VESRQRCRGCRQYKGIGDFNNKGYCPLCLTRNNVVIELQKALDSILDCHIRSITDKAWERARLASIRAKDIGVGREMA